MMTRRKILLIAPLPTHPSATGASARVRHIAESLLGLGHEVHFLYLQQRLLPSDRYMREFWKERLHTFHSLSPGSLLGRARRKLIRLTGKVFHLNLPVDSYFDPEAAHYLRNLLATHGFDVTILSYIFYSRLLEFVPGPVLKLIDTQDVFSDRYRLYRKHGQANEFFSTCKAEEGKALDRSDCVLAIQEWDAEHFRSITKRPVQVVGHLAPPAEAIPASAVEGAPVMLFVGSPMGINVHGITWFIDHVLPVVRGHVPDAELWLVGNIGDRIGAGGQGVRCFGFVNSVADFYRRAAVVINPQQFGTGLSIKSIDALRYGCPLVTTTSGARGLEEAAGTAFLQAESAQEFGDCLIELLRDPKRRAELAERGGEFAARYRQRNLQALADVVSRSAAR